MVPSHETSKVPRMDYTVLPETSMCSTWIMQTTQCLPLPCKCSPDGANLQYLYHAVPWRSVWYRYCRVARCHLVHAYKAK